MALGSTSELVLDYDQEADVLYASVGAPQPAVSDEVGEDLWLRYCPPSPDVVGITIVNFRHHYPHAEAHQIVSRLLKQYPIVPWDIDEC
jgi:uncharacterized protein YuzE